ncbi:hypothetical protein GCM10010238_45150 [Streptomyces griseoviridis]|uniref:DUF4142 domain-containing protein n=1 Tax=Streptomyces griseoviridis TaxID=45398 RepID=A0A918GNL8_STRGD|nr:hypothetical protein GCM10010238_45150 [Streptomyces niveoruber]
MRAAGLWEYPLGLPAMERGTTAEMREAGEHLVAGHARLDATCRRIGPEPGVALPNRASPQQQRFVAAVEGTTGRQFDTTAVTIMRVAHGQIFPAIARIRAGTGNSLVRQLADQTDDTVLDQISVLERAGLVNFDRTSLQQTAPPKPTAARTTPPAPQPGEPVVGGRRGRPRPTRPPPNLRVRRCAETGVA